MYRYGIFLFAFLALLPFQAHAETLDDATIRALYHEPWELRATGKRDELKHETEDRLAQGFTLTSNTTQQVLDHQPLQSTKTYDRATSIQNALKAMDVTKMDGYKENVTDIRYADDKKTATVTDASSESGVMTLPADAQHTITVKYTSEETCVDKVALIDAKIRILSSECNDRFVVTR